MSFTADKQTLDDLNLLGRHRPQSIYSFFNKVRTAGGEKLLAAMFREPMSDAGEINRRSLLFRYFARKTVIFPFDGDKVTLVEDYLGAGAPGAAAGNRGNLIASTVQAIHKRVSAMALHSEGYRQLEQAVTATCRICTTLSRLLGELADAESPYAEEHGRLLELLGDRRLQQIVNTRPQVSVNSNPSLLRLAKWDHLFRHTLRPHLREILDAIYRLDVYIAVADVATSHDFAYAKALPGETRSLEIEGLWHPVVTKAVQNSLSLDRADKNMLFLTGANMAGKSTFMKAFGVALYLAHMGFPVAAHEMTFPIMDGLYSSINVADNLAQGYSHFYAEVLRVKKVAGDVAAGRRLIVLFDELFKGTNVKDAFEATLAVTEALAAYTGCWFIISTHIIEVGQVLGRRCGNILFRYLPTVMEEGRPRYTYRLEEGITADRHGMLIIRNEGILEIIKSS